MKKIGIIVSLMVLTACGKSDSASFTDVNRPEHDEDQHCMIEDYTMVCRDGTIYVLPIEIVTVIEPTIVLTESCDPDETEAICERDNRNQLKCRKIKKELDR